MHEPARTPRGVAPVAWVAPVVDRGSDLGPHVLVYVTRTKNLCFMTTSGTAAARPSCAVTHFILYRASSAVRLSVAFFPLCLSLRSSPFPLLYRAKVCFMTTGGTAAACRSRAATHTVRAFTLFAARPSAALPLLCPYLTSTVLTLPSDYFCPSRRVFRRYERSERAADVRRDDPARARSRPRPRPPTADRRPPTADPDLDLDLRPRPDACVLD